MNRDFDDDLKEAMVGKDIIFFSREDWMFQEHDFEEKIVTTAYARFNFLVLDKVAA